MSHRGYRKLWIFMAIVVCLIYLVYRGVYTLNWSTPYSIFASWFLYVGEMFGISALMFYFIQVWEVTEPPQQPAMPGRTVDVFVPTYNEDVSILRATLSACVRLDYPHKTYVLDDGRRPEVKALADELGVSYITRENNVHAKAGNLNHAFEKTDGEFIVIFDADHVPLPHFINRVLGYFADEKLGFVQTPHAFYNFESFQAEYSHSERKYWEDGQLFYHVIQPGRNRWNAAIFAGSAAMFRRSALAEVGYIATETITEDMHTGLRIHARGWKSLAISERLIAGQAAPDITTFHSQRLRWGEGNLSIIAHDNPLTMSGLTMMQRLSYFGAMISWATGFFKLAIYLTPILMLFTGQPPVSDFTWTLALITATYLVVTLYAIKVAANGYGSLLNVELFLMIGFWTQVKGLFRALFWRRFQRFVVTSKRGRQEKSVWPYIRPHVLLIVLSVLALAWGWGKLVLQISDDYYRPIIPTCWILLHGLLAWIVIRRSLTPEDRRFAYRHLVHLPVSYRRPDGTANLGLTADLNETGMALYAYEPLTVGEALQLTVHGPGEEVTVEGQVVSVKENRGGTPFAPRDLKGTRYGVSFRDVQPSQADVVNRLCLGYAVPRLNMLYDAESQGVGGGVGRLFSRRRLGQRYNYRLPMVIQRPGSSGSSIFNRPLVTVTEDISRGAAAGFLAEKLPPNAVVSYAMQTPLGEVRGTAKVLRTDERLLGGRNLEMTVLQFDHYEGQGRSTLQALCADRLRISPNTVLHPIKEPPRVPVARALAIGILVAAPLVLLEYGFFRNYFRDDLALREFNKSPAPAPALVQDVDRIFEDTVATPYPSTDRLVLMMEALRIQLAKVTDTPEYSSVIKKIDDLIIKLAPRDRRNLDLQLALANSYYNTNRFDESEHEYERLLELDGRSLLLPDQKVELLRAAARANVRKGDLPNAIKYFRELMKLTNVPLVRNEFAGVLIQAHDFRGAADLYKGIKPDRQGQFLLAAICVLQNNYPGAEDVCSDILRSDPNDKDAQELLSQIQDTKSGYERANLILKRLEQIGKNDSELSLKRAELTLWSRLYPEAAEKFHTLLASASKSDKDYMVIVKGFIDAAASCVKEQLHKDYVATAQSLYADTINYPGPGYYMGDLGYHRRLAWVLRLLGDYDDSQALIEKVMLQLPNDLDLRGQYIDTLIHANKVQEALKFLERNENDPKNRQVMIGILLELKRYQAAEDECRRLLAVQGQDTPENQELLADILTAKREYAKATEIFERLAKEAKSTTRRSRYEVRLAELTLLDGAYGQAIARYQALLARPAEKKPGEDREYDQVMLATEKGFVFAAAGAAGATENAADPAKALNAQNVETLLQTYKQSQDTELWQDPMFLTRLAYLLAVTKQPVAQTNKLLKAAIDLDPKEPTNRKELGNVLAFVERFKDALKMYEGVPLNGKERVQLVRIYNGAELFNDAVREARTALKERPDDEETQTVLAESLYYNKEYKESYDRFKALAHQHPDDEKLALIMARAALAAGAAYLKGNADEQMEAAIFYNDALARFAAILSKRFDQPEVWFNFIDAASSASALVTPGKRDVYQPLLRRVYDKVIVGKKKPPFFVADLDKDLAYVRRLAWSMEKVEQWDVSIALLRIALAQDESNAQVRLQLANLLYRQNQFVEANYHYRLIYETRATQPKTPPTR